MTSDQSPRGHATGAVRTTLQFEGGVIAIAGCVAFAQTGASWWLFAALILVPDLAMVGYLIGARVGAFAYNLAHTYCAPAGLAAFAWGFGMPDVWPLVAGWVVHIGADRALGYGLKYSTGFKATHLSSA